MYLAQHRAAHCSIESLRIVVKETAVVFLRTLVLLIQKIVSNFFFILGASYSNGYLPADEKE